MRSAANGEPDEHESVSQAVCASEKLNEHESVGRERGVRDHECVHPGHARAGRSSITRVARAVRPERTGRTRGKVQTRLNHGLDIQRL